MKLSKVSSPRTQPHRKQHQAKHRRSHPLTLCGIPASPCKSDFPWVSRKHGESQPGISLESCKHEPLGPSDTQGAA